MFEKLDKRIREILRKEGYQKETEAQRKAIPAVLSGKNVLLIAPTGMGKTESCLLPILTEMLKEPSPGVSFLYITPLRALNRDLLHRFEDMCNKLNLSISIRHGDTPVSERVKQTKHPPQIMISTPETFLIMLNSRRMREHLRNVKYVVIDEIHELAGNERGAQLAVTLERLKNIAKNRFQRIGLSATVGNPEEVAEFLVGSDEKPEIVIVPGIKEMEIKIEITRGKSSDEEILPSVKRCVEICEKFGNSLLFVNTRDTAELIASRIKIYFPTVKSGIHHGSLHRDVRIKMEDGFKNGDISLLVCTSSLELGIDIGLAEYIIQFNSPRQVSKLVQRIGRSGHRIHLTSKGTVVCSNILELLESAAIAARAKKGKIERINIIENSISVIANQILAFIVGERNCTPLEIYNTMKMSYPFRNLKFEDFMDVLLELKKRGRIFFDGELCSRRKNSIPFFYSNVSMIYDESKCVIIDATSQKKIGTLDESFVMSYLSPGKTFIVKGDSWKVIEICGREVVVVPYEGIGELPSWIGEEIPVPFEVAQDVGRMLRMRCFPKDLMDEYSIKCAEEYIDAQKNHIMPDDRTIVIECAKEAIVMHAFFGTKVNETLGHIISSLMSQKYGTSIGVKSNAYRIVFAVPQGARGDEIKNILKTIQQSDIETIVKKTCSFSLAFKWEFVKSAERFGVIDKNADKSMINIDKLIEILRDTPVYKDACRKIMEKKMDIKNLEKVVEGIRNREIKVLEGDVSPLGRDALEEYMRYVVPDRLDSPILKILEERLLDSKLKLGCLNCGRIWHQYIRNSAEKIECVKCNGRMISVLFTNDDEKSLKRKMKGIFGKDLKKLYKSASLVSSYGKDALIAMAGRGIGPDVASRIFGMQYLTRTDFLRAILKAEIKYARTRKFWDV